MKRFDLRSLRFDESGEAWRRLPVDVAPFVFGGLDYEVAGGAVDLLLTAGRVGDNITLVAEFETEIVGPCQRCLGDAAVAVGTRAVEYVRHGDSEAADEQGGEPGYVASNVVDLERWIRDLVAEALPEKLLCDDECRGLCPACGADLNDDPDHQHETA
jgi:DUF177 domain-containing protein